MSIFSFKLLFVLLLLITAWNTKITTVDLALLQQKIRIIILNFACNLNASFLYDFLMLGTWKCQVKISPQTDSNRP